MKKILFITAFPPCDKAGGGQVTLAAIKSLSTRYVIDLIYFDYKGHENLANDYINSVKVFNPSNKGIICKPLFFPLFTRRFNFRILKYIESIKSDYDILFFDFSQIAIYSLYINHPYKIIRCHDIISQKYGRSNKLLLPWVKFTENKILKSANKVFALTEKDTNLIKLNYNISANYSYDVFNLVNYDISEDVSVENKFIFFGYWKRKENSDGLAWFIKNVYPLLYEEKKKSLVVMGGGMDETFKQQYLSKYSIPYLGYVKNSHMEIEKCLAMICPLFQGAGIKIKVLDSYITGTPVIGTDVAFEGISYIENLEFRCNKAEEFAKTINMFKLIDFKDKKKYRHQFDLIRNGNQLLDMI